MGARTERQALNLVLAGGGGALFVLAAVALNPGGMFSDRSAKPLASGVAAFAPVLPPSNDAMRAPPPTTSVPSMRQRIREAIDAAPVSSAAQLDGYLDGLVEQARKKGMVTALEVEPGLEMIARYADDEEKQAVFSRRMQALQAQLSKTKPEPAPDEQTASNRIAALAQAIATAEGEAKQALIRQYLELANHLPEERMGEALAKLNSLAGQPQAPADLAAAEALWAGIESAEDNDMRQTLIREYSEFIQGLPPEEEEKHVARLNQRFGRRDTVKQAE